MLGVVNGWVFWASLVVVIAYPTLDGADVYSMGDLRQVLCMFDRVGVVLVLSFVV